MKRTQDKTKHTNEKIPILPITYKRDMKIDQKHKIDKLSIRQTSRLFGERKACARNLRGFYSHTHTNQHTQTQVAHKQAIA